MQTSNDNEKMLPNGTCNDDIVKLQNQYAESLCEKDKVAYDIAKSYLGSAFELEKTAGFLEWKSTHNK